MSEIDPTKIEYNSEITADDLSAIETEGFWYAITNGYLDVENILIDEELIKKIKDAISTLEKFEGFVTNLYEQLNEEESTDEEDDEDYDE